MPSISSNDYVAGSTLNATEGTTATTPTTTTAEIKKTSMQPIKDMVESLDGEVSTKGQYLQYQSEPKLPSPDSKMADGTVDDEKEKSFKLPYDRNEKKLIREDFVKSVDAGLSEYVKSQNLNPKESEVLMDKLSKAFVALTNGETPKIPETELSALKEIEKNTTDAIKKQYALPSTWTVTSKDEAVWTPVAGIETKGIDPLRFNQLVILEGIKSGLTTLEDMEMAGQTLLDKVPNGNSDKILVQAYLKAISTAIQKLKEFLFHMQAADAEKQKSTQQIKFGLNQSINEVRDKQMTNAQEMQAKQKVMGGLGTFLKVAGPILSAVLTIVGAATSVLLGAGLILVAIGVLIGTAATAYAIVDSCTDCTQKLFELVDKLISDAIKSANNGQDIPALRQTIKVLAIVTLVAVLCLPILLNPGGSSSIAGNAAQATVAQIIRSIILEFVKQLSLQIISTVLMPSISQAIMPLIKETGIIKTIAKELKWDEQILTSVVEGFVTVLCVAILLGLNLKSGRDSGKLSQKFKDVTTAAEEAGGKASNINTLAKLLGSNEQGQLQNLSKMLSKILGGDTKDISKAISTGVSVGTTGAEVGQVALKAGSGVAKAVMYFQMAKLHSEKGDVDAAEESIRGLIEILEKLLQQIQSGLTSETDFTATLTGMQKKMFRDATQSLNSIFQG